MKTVLIRLAAALAIVPVWAVSAQQNAGVIMREGAVTEAAIIDALNPITLRDFKVEASGAAQPPKAGAASLLITFETNSTQLTPQAKASLDVVGKALNADRLHGLSFEIEGHADPRGPDETNQMLSQARAASVRQYLVQAQNIDETRLKAVGKGERFPLRPDDPAAPENRRVTFKTVTP